MQLARAREHPVAAIRVLETSRGGEDLGHPGDAARPAATGPAERPEGQVREDEVVDHLLGLAPGSGGLVGASVPLGERPARVGDPVELDVVGAGHEPVQVIGRISSTRIGSSMACNRKARTAWIVTVETMPRAPTPTRAASRTSGFCSGVATTTGAIAGDQPEPDDPTRDVAEVPAGAVGGGRGGSGDRLVRDVAHVLESQSPQIELLAQSTQGDA